MYGKSKVVSHHPVDQSLITDYDVILCGKNKTREELNDTIRENILHFQGRKPMLGDKIICRQNDWSEMLNGIYLTNGLVGTITDIDYCSLYRNIVYLDFQPDFMEESFAKLSIDYKYMKADWKERKDFGFTKLSKFEYAYALTVHLSQGSEYPRVLYIDEPFHDPDTQRRLQYTAITRAMDQITYVKQERKKQFQTYNYNGFQYRLSSEK